MGVINYSVTKIINISSDIKMLAHCDTVINENRIITGTTA